MYCIISDITCNPVSANECNSGVKFEVQNCHPKFSHSATVMKIFLNTKNFSKIYYNPTLTK